MVYFIYEVLDVEKNLFKQKWRRLDNTAKAFSMEEKNFTNTFRLSVILKEWFALFLYLLASALFSYKLFYQRKKLNRQQYNHIRSTQDTSEWTRTTIFTDVIKVLEGNTETVYQHSYIKKITEDDKYYYLWHNSDSVIRLPKDGFIVGDGKEFKNYIIDRIYENRATS